MNKELEQKEKELLDLARLFETKKAEYERAKDKYNAKEQDSLLVRPVLMALAHSEPGIFEVQAPANIEILNSLRIPGVILVENSVNLPEKLRGIGNVHAVIILNHKGPYRELYQFYSDSIAMTSLKKMILIRH